MLKESAVFVLIIGFMISPAGLIAGFSAQSTPPQSTERFAGVRATILEVLQKSGVPSISIAAAEDGRIVWEESFGFADKEKKIAATPESMYSLDLLHQPSSLSAPSDVSRMGASRMAMGWGVVDLASHRFVIASDSAPGTQTRLTLLPEKNMAVSILCNAPTTATR